MPHRRVVHRPLLWRSSGLAGSAGYRMRGRRRGRPLSGEWSHNLPDDPADHLGLLAVGGIRHQRLLVSHGFTLVFEPADDADDPRLFERLPRFEGGGDDVAIACVVEVDDEAEVVDFDSPVGLSRLDLL